MRGGISVYKLEGNQGTRISLDWTHPISYPLTARTRDQVAPVYTRVLPINFAHYYWVNTPIYITQNSLSNNINIGTKIILNLKQNNIYYGVLT